MSRAYCAFGPNSDESHVKLRLIIENRELTIDKAKVCKTFIRRFDSDPRLQPFQCKLSGYFYLQSCSR